jgi:1-acyl-sn-glycerol-3-phosphate acyltransferase
MRTDQILVNYAIKQVIRLFCKIDEKELDKVPDSGPLIIVSNHINFIEVPLLYTHLIPRPVTGFAKAEGWKNPFLRYLANLWGAIPLHRGEADVAAIRAALNALDQNKIVGLAPEGTRSGDGKLRRGHQGVVTLALQSGAQLLPLVFFGNEAYLDDIKRLRRINFNIVIGNKFSIYNPNGKINHKKRQKMTDEIMYQLAALLPPFYRGYYSDLRNATENFLLFPNGSISNINVENT